MNFKIKVKGKDNRNITNVITVNGQDIFKFGLHTMYLCIDYYIRSLAKVIIASLSGLRVQQLS